MTEPDNIMSYCLCEQLGLGVLGLFLLGLFVFCACVCENTRGPVYIQRAGLTCHFVL